MGCTSTELVSTALGREAAVRLQHGDAVRPRPLRVRTADDSLDWLAARIDLIGVAFDVHEPPELVDHLAHLATHFAAATRRPVSANRR